MNSIYSKSLFVNLLLLLLTACNEITEIEKEYMDAEPATKLLRDYLTDHRAELVEERVIVTAYGPDELNNVLEVNLIKLNRKKEK
ncbi:MULTISPECIES: hypothetical protein [unclassified Sporosarcina]|uniref:hypothetical protein n=1 Tax=unclassified Sporosarcina TaxID=2647733 RepID=UPI0030F55FE7